MLLFYLSLIETEEDKSKFERLYNQYKNLMKHIATDMLNDEWSSEDAVHEAFIKLTRHIKIVDENNCHKTKAFIVIIIKNVCRDMLRKESNKKDTIISLEDMDNVAYTNEDMFKNIELQDVYAAIESLPDTYREITELKLYYDLSDKDIADIVGINNAAVRKRIQRAKEILRKKLAKRSEDNVSV